MRITEEIYQVGGGNLTSSDAKMQFLHSGLCNFCTPDYAIYLINFDGHAVLPIVKISRCRVRQRFEQTVRKYQGVRCRTRADRIYSDYPLSF